MLGKIEKLTEWGNKKGYYVKLNGKEFVSYGTPLARIGQEVEYEVGELAIDKKHYVVRIRQPRASAIPAATNKEGQPITRLIPSDHPENKDARRDYYTNKEKADREREPVITMLSCISSACVLAQNSTANVSADQIVAISEVFFTAAMKKRVQP